MGYAESRGRPMSGTSDNTLIFRILQQIQEGQAATHATLSRLERAVVRHDRKFAETELRFNHIDQRFSHLENRLNDVQAGVRDAVDELESIIKMELGGQTGMLKVQVGHRLDALEERIAALEQGPPP